MRWSLPLCLLLSGGVMMFSCKKPTLNENNTLPNSSLGILFTDTLTVRTYTEREDSLRGDNQAVNILGSMNDPVFGKSFASIYSQFALPVNNLNLGSNLVVDSIVLCMTYVGSYGNNNVPMNIQVYRVNESYSVDSIYYTNRTFATQPTLLGSLTNFVPNLTDSVYLSNAKLDHDTLGHRAHMRIRLDNSLGQDIINQSGGANVVDNPTFQNYFKGLYITPDTNNPGGNVVYIDMAAAESHLSIYYKSSNNSDTNNDTVIYFYSNSLAKVVEHFQHNYNNSSVAGVLGNNSFNGDSLIFLQALSGVKGKVYVPYIRNLGNIAINKAELVFTAIGDSTYYPNPNQVTINSLTSTGADTIVPDQALGLDYFDGYKFHGLTRPAVANSQYGLNLALYFQHIIQGTAESGLHVYPTPPNRSGDRVVFAGGTYSDPKYRVKLNLTYTKLK